MNFLNNLDKNKRLNFVRFEEKYNIIKNIKNGVKLKGGIRWIYSTNLNQKLWKKSQSKIKNKCVLSGRSRSVYKFARLSRIFLRNNDYIGYLPGLRKSYW